MSKLGLLQQHGPCECTDPTLYAVEHQGLKYNTNGNPVGSFSETDYRCTDCGGVQFER